MINGNVFWLEKSDKFNDDEIGLNSFQRQTLKIALTGTVNVSIYTAPKDKEFRLSLIKLELEIVKHSEELQVLEIDDPEFAKIIKQVFK